MYTSQNIWMFAWVAYATSTTLAQIVGFNGRRPCSKALQMFLDCFPPMGPRTTQLDFVESLDILLHGVWLQKGGGQLSNKCGIGIE